MAEPPRTAGAALRARQQAARERQAALETFNCLDAQHTRLCDLVPEESALLRIVEEALEKVREICER
jgi:hypothetical protein